MFAQLKLYLIIGLFIAVIALGGGWYLSHSLQSAEIDTLTQRNVTLTTAVDQQKQTIEQMLADAQTLAATNRKLTSTIIASEMDLVDEWSAINALDLESGEVLATPDQMALTINDAFMRSVEDLRAATSR